MPVLPTSAELRTLLREQFGCESFRPGQERIIRDLLGGRDVLAVLPTGAGKSLVFQLAAQLLPGVTLVVSPLIALMKDQAESLEARGMEVGVINSARTAAQSEEELEKVEREEARLLYVTPERFEDPGFMAEMEGLEVSLLVVDEAHCVSEWGYDFRPSYLGLAGAAERLGRPTRLALTATATPWVRRDIIERLGLRSPNVVVASVDRPNLFLEVRRVQTEEEDHRVLRQLLLEEPSGAAAEGRRIEPDVMRSLVPAESACFPPELQQQLARAMRGSGIIYCATTRAAEETAGWLQEWGIPADYYHGQRRKADRDRIQDGFMAGELRVIAATNAFGLGVDKPDVRFVIHRHIPGSVEEYYQEAGRAGRDGELARCTLIYRPADLGRAAFLSSSSQLAAEDVINFHEALAANPSAPLAELAKAAGLRKSKAARLLSLLEREGIAEERQGALWLRGPDFDPARISLASEEDHRAYQRSRLQMMRHYAELWECRRVYLLNYFGQETGFDHCGMCDNDARQPASAEPPESAVAPVPGFAPGDRVRHTRWGEGEVVAATPGALTVRFAHGEEKLAADLVQEEHLLAPVRTHTGKAGDGMTPADQVDRTDRIDRPATAGEAALRIGEQVVHDRFGAGEVERVTDTGVTVLFEHAGYKTVEEAALEAADVQRAGTDG